MALVATLDPVTKRITYKDDGAAASPILSMPGVTGPSAPQAINQGTPRPTYGQYLSELEQSRGLPQGYLAQIRAVESSNGTNTVNPNSSARGDFQFTRGTGKAYGVNVNDPWDSARGAADYAADNSKMFKGVFGRTPTGQDLYGMHQQGGGGYINLVKGIAPGGAAQNLNGGAGLSASGFLDKIHSMYNNAKPDISGDPTARAGGGSSANAPLPGAQGPVNQPTATPPATPTADPAQQKYDGGLIGLLQGGDYTGAGSGKDLTGKLGDFTGSQAFTTGAKAVAGLFAPPQQTVRAPGIQPTGGDDVNRPNLSLLQMMMPRG